LGRSREAFLYEYTIYYVFFFILVLIGGFMREPLSYIFVSFSVSSILTLLFLIFDSYRMRILVWAKPSSRLAGELLKFSIPLLLAGLMGMILTWTDTLMLGYFYGTRMVGYYKVASPIARSLPFFLAAVTYMYLPIATQLYSLSRIQELKRVYQVLSKWVFLLTFPIFLLVFSYPRATIGFLFGSKYLPSASPLQILAIGFMFYTMMGLSGTSLVVIKDNNFLLFSTGVAGALNILLNYLLIPPYGMVGAAIATVLSYALATTLNQLRLYKKTGIHPFTRAYIKPLAVSSFLTAILWVSGVSAPSIWRALLILFVFILSYLILVIASKSIEKEDLELLRKIGRRTGVNIDKILLFLEKFVS
jgi:O-antigen/teichoic acid export membrane protein